MDEKLMLVVKIILFIVFFSMVVYGQQTVGKIYLLVQLVGLTGLLYLLWNYNKQYT